jgi:hypothetical protein
MTRQQREIVKNIYNDLKTMKQNFVELHSINLATLDRNLKDLEFLFSKEACLFTPVAESSFEPNK